MIQSLLGWKSLFYAPSCKSQPLGSPTHNFKTVIRRDSPQWELNSSLRKMISKHFSCRYELQLAGECHQIPFFLWLLREAKTAVHPLAGLGALPFRLAFCFNVFQMRTECWNTSANVSSSCVGGVLQLHHAVPLLYNQHLAPFLTERIGAKRGKQFSFQSFREGRGRGESTENIFCPV